jgi:cyclic pyranopterin phosphate synthase
MAAPAVSAASDVQRTTENGIERPESSREGNDRLKIVEHWISKGDFHPHTRVIRPSDNVTEASQTAVPSSESRPVLSHVDANGKANMVDVSAKPATQRSATAHAIVRFSNDAAYQSVLHNANSKGDVLGVARIAGIMAAKRTAELIPLCHPIAITNVDVDATLVPRNDRKQTSHMRCGIIRIRATVDCIGPTGVEMEALTAANVAALTVFDMCKAVDKGMIISSKLIRKSGGSSGLWRAPPGQGGPSGDYST